MKLFKKPDDRELEEFRSLMEIPSTFVDGFNFRSLIGALFLGLVMVPGGIYMGLMAGQGIGGASQWVTVILFMEAARRARQTMNRAELFILFYLAAGVMAVPFGGLLWQQFYIQSDAARATGIAQQLPGWWAPSDPEILAQRTFFHRAWFVPIALSIWGLFMGRLNQLVLGYGLFHLTSDIEKLPFPMAPIGAQGIAAMAEDLEKEKYDEKQPQKKWRWRVFCLGSGLGMMFGALYLGVPTITGAFLPEPIEIFPIPFVDWSPRTASFLPAVATGLSFDLGNLIIGMVMPFYAMLGSFFGLVFTMFFNPILYRLGHMPSWTPGDSTVATLFNTRMDFYFSFGIGLGFAIAAAGILQVIRQTMAARKKKADPALAAVDLGPKDLQHRGDIRMIWVILAYIFTTASYVLVAGKLLDWHRGAIIVFSIIGFGYAPLMTYVRTRLEGMVGQTISIPMVMEIGIILSGYQGAAIWFVPKPEPELETYAVRYRVAELLGCRLRSIWKAQIFLTPIIIVSSIFFLNFIWGIAPIPSPRFPLTERLWELGALNASIMITSTMGGFSQFEQALKLPVLALGAGLGLGGFVVFGALGVPTMFLYGAVRGLDQTMPHSVLPQFIGALIGHFYFKKRFKKNWRPFITVFASGFGCGVGLLSMLAVGFTFLQNAVITLPF